MKRWGVRFAENPTIDTCYKKIEKDGKGSMKSKESTLNCYGCGASGYYRSNCPNCSKWSSTNATEKLDCNALHTAIVGRNVPTVGINIEGLDGEAYFDTRTSVAGFTLYQKLRSKNIQFQSLRGNNISW